MPPPAPSSRESTPTLRIEVEDDSPDSGDSLGELIFTVNGDVELTPGVVIAERYRVLSEIGTGAMGAVYLAEHLTVGRKVAVKVLLGEWSAVPEVAERFAAEARTASSIGHPGIVDVLDAGCLDDGRLYLVMEYLEGDDLGIALDLRGRFPAVEACQLIRRVAEAISAAHAAGVVHRDLKPDNIIVIEREDRSVVKVLDFGVASNHRLKVGAAATSPGAVIGTPSHMSPEQALGEAAGPDFDIYALGSILFTLLVGHPPFDDPNAMKVLGLKQTTAAPAIDDLRAGLPAPLSELVDDTLALDRERRPATVEEFIARLDDALAAAPPPPAEVATTGARRWWSLAILLGGAILVLGLGAVMILPASDQEADIDPTVGATTPLGSAAGAKASEGERSGVADAGSSTQSSGSASASGSTGAGSGSTGSDSGSDSASGSTAALDPNASADAPSGEDTGKGSTKRAPSRSSAEHLTERCAQVREQARLARDAYRWPSLLELAKKRSCWAKSRDARKFEVQARMETGDFSGCISAAAKSKDPDVIRWRDLCRKRSGQ